MLVSIRGQRVKTVKAVYRSAAFKIFWLNFLIVFPFQYYLDTGLPTFHYNASVLSDMFLEQHLHHLYKCITDFPGMKDAVALIKVWLHQRELDKVWTSPSSLFTTMIFISERCNKDLAIRFENENCAVDTGKYGPVSTVTTCCLIAFSRLSCLMVGQIPLLRFSYYRKQGRLPVTTQ